MVRWVNKQLIDYINYIAGVLLFIYNLPAPDCIELSNKPKRSMQFTKQAIYITLQLNQNIYTKDKKRN